MNVFKKHKTLRKINKTLKKRFFTSMVHCLSATLPSVMEAVSNHKSAVLSFWS